MQSAPIYLRIESTNAKSRLTYLRNRAANTAGHTWRDARKWNMKNWRDAYMSGLHQGTDANKNAIWCSHKGPNFRSEKYADEVSSIDHTGWFTDVDQSEKARGIVARLTHGRFIAGYHWDSNDERVYFPEIFDDEDDAARAADSHAESFAEIAREDSEKYDAARDLENTIEDSLQRLRECLVLRHRQCMGYVRDEIAELIETIRDARQSLATEYAEYV